MNRLWVRLTLAFGLVALVGTGVIALLTNWQAGEQVRQYLVRQDTVAQSGLLDELSNYYRTNGGWQGVDEVMAGFSSGRGLGAGSGRGRPSMMLADVNGLIQYDERNARVGDTLAAQEKGSALPIIVNGKMVGYLSIGSAGANGIDTSASQLLDQLRQTLLLATLLAVLLSVVLGALLGRWLAAPLARMTDGARHYSRHQWSARIPETGSTEIAEVARALNEMANSLEQAEKSRRSLTADIAHELRTPLTVLQGNLRAILDGVYPMESAEIASLYDQTRLLSRLVDDLRQLALADSGKPAVRLERVNLAQIVREVADEFMAAADAKYVTIERNVPDEEIWVLADPDRLRQVLFNLTINAIQHTPENGHLVLDLACANKLAIVSVVDSGKGISEKELTRVFDRFYRVDPSDSAQSSGTGLGLAVAKAWMEAMNGQIGAESRLGEGSRFWFHLPLAP
jgi:signal transduction histidine kinase